MDPAWWFATPRVNGGKPAAIGELTALLGTYAALVQILLMARLPWIEKAFGMDSIAHWHRWLGFATVTTICAHVVFTTWGYALGDGKSIPSETWTFFTHIDVFMATVATAMLIGIAVTSLRAARRRMKYETWQSPGTPAPIWPSLWRSRMKWPSDPIRPPITSLKLSLLPYTSLSSP